MIISQLKAMTMVALPILDRATLENSELSLDVQLKAHAAKTALMELNLVISEEELVDRLKTVSAGHRSA